MLTKVEKRALQYLALTLDKTESDLMRERLQVDELVAEADRRRALAGVS